MSRVGLAHDGGALLTHSHKKILDGVNCKAAKRTGSRSLCETLSIWLSCETPFHITKVIEAFHKCARSRAHHPVIMESTAKPLSGYEGMHFVERFPCDRCVERRSTTQV